MYKTTTKGFGERLSCDHHEIIAAIAPHAVIVTTANNDYADATKDDCIIAEGARPVFRFPGSDRNLGINIRRTNPIKPAGPGGGHMLDNIQIMNLVEFTNMVFYNIPLSEEL